MKMILMIALAIVIGLGGCGESSSSEVVTVDDGEIVTLEANQTVGYLPNTDVQIINIGEGAYYITCNGSEDCTVHIGNVDDNTDSSTTTDNNSSS